MYVEVIRGLALGGAETLLYLRLRDAVERGLVSPSGLVVVNTSAPHDHFAEPLRELGIEVVGLQHAGVAGGGRELVSMIAERWPRAPLVVHSPAPALAIKAGKAVNRLQNPVIEVAHSTQYRRGYTGLGHTLNRFADVCLPVSAEVARANTTSGFRAKRVVHGGVDRQRMRAWVEDQGVDGGMRRRRDLGVHESAQLVVAVGNLVPLKGHHDLIAGFRQALDSGRDAHLVIVGEGPERSRLEHEIADLDLADRVRLLGRSPDAWTWLALADVQCHPSRFEGLPVALMEGAALSLPIVATDIAGTRDFSSRTPGVQLIPVGSHPALGRALEKVLSAAPPFPHVFNARGAAETYWDIQRYTHEMVEIVERALQAPVG